MITAYLLSAITILLPAESGVHGPEIELTEIVTVQGADAQTLKTLEGIELGGAPAPGYRRVFTRSDILARIRKIDPTIKVSFGGRAAVSVFMKTMIVKGERMVAEVERELSKLRGQRDVTWKQSETIGDVEIPESDSGEAVVEVELGVTVLASGRLVVKIRLMSSGSAYRTVWADWDVVVWEQLPVLTRDVVAGSRVSAEMFVLKRTVLPAAGFESVLSPQAMIGAVATRNLVAGNVVVGTDVTRPSVVHVGDPVTLIVRKGAIRAAVAAVALDTGGIGDIIRIKRVDSTTSIELKGRVISDDTVEIDLTK